ncbi:MAG TPA: choice-of-anchor tandem repeat GloVer-containing protein [Terriglobales bacterium]
MIGPDGSLYGTTYQGGGGVGFGCGDAGCGTVFNVRPPAAACPAAFCPGTETVLHRFTDSELDGAAPLYTNLVFDQAGNFYGTTSGGGAAYAGTVFKLTPSNGTWKESILYSFPGGTGGAGPDGGVIFDAAGNLYGTTDWGGTSAWGVVFELTPSASGWTENVLYSFQNGSDGANPIGGLIFDQSGNLYGTTYSGGANGGGTVYQLSPSSGGWTLTTLYSFSGSGGSVASLTMDASGNLYCTTEYDGAYGGGNVCKLTRSTGGWSYTSLHDFTGGSDGAYLLGRVTLDTNGNLYGTASAGGAHGAGVVWEIMP